MNDPRMARRDGCAAVRCVDPKLTLLHTRLCGREESMRPRLSLFAYGRPTNLSKCCALSMTKRSKGSTVITRLIVGVLVLLAAGVAEAQFNPYCMWGPNDILCQSEKMRQGFLQECHDGDPHHLDFDAMNDCCIYNGTDCAGKFIAHSNWLYQQCKQGNNAACAKLQRTRAPSPPPSAYPRPPYPPGYER
jgi:hypothetical protein